MPGSSGQWLDKQEGLCLHAALFTHLAAGLAVPERVVGAAAGDDMATAAPTAAAGLAARSQYVVYSMLDGSPAQTRRVACQLIPDLICVSFDVMVAYCG